MLLFRLKKQTCKNIADTTFKHTILIFVLTLKIWHFVSLHNIYSKTTCIFHWLELITATPDFLKISSLAKTTREFLQTNLLKKYISGIFLAFKTTLEIINPVTYIVLSPPDTNNCLCYIVLSPPDSNNCLWHI